MEIEMNKGVFRIGLTITLIWNIYQLFAAKDNIILMVLSCITFLISIIGIFLTLSGEDIFRKIYIEYYIVTATLLLLQSILGNFEWQIESLPSYNSYNLFPLEPPIPGTSKDYANAITSHYISLLLPILSMIAAYLAPLFQRIVNSFR